LPERRGAAKTKAVSPARWAAFQVLERVQTTDAHSDDLLHGAALHGSSQEDKNLATALVMGVLRWQIALDAELRGLLDRPEQTMPEAVWIALRMGAFQLRHMDRIPAHAALSESVELVRVAGHPKAAGMVNAVLRKVAAASGAARRPIVESVAAMAERLGHPGWMVERWVKEYGRAAATAVCEYDQREPGEGDWFEEEAAGERSAPVMDAGSRLVAEIAAASVAEPKRIWDACAAPGGKTAVLARRHAAAEVLATDVSARRLEAMRRRLEREIPGRTIEMREADAARLPASAGRFDLILCDVPCSGTGTLARNPEIRLRLRGEDLERQAWRQREILSAALGRLNARGRLVYSTCSLELEENEAVVRAVVEASGARVIPVGELVERLVVPGGEGLVRGEFLRTLPGANFEGDGFFAAVLEKGK
jgi:16S rRNA (cytosine967-C5)-methyltransferase